MAAAGKTYKFRDAAHANLWIRSDNDNKIIAETIFKVSTGSATGFNFDKLADLEAAATYLAGQEFTAVETSSGHVTAVSVNDVIFVPASFVGIKSDFVLSKREVYLNMKEVEPTPRFSCKRYRFIKGKAFSWLGKNYTNREIACVIRDAVHGKTGVVHLATMLESLVFEVGCTNTVGAVGIFVNGKSLTINDLPIDAVCYFAHGDLERYIIEVKEEEEKTMTPMDVKNAVDKNVLDYTHGNLRRAQEIKQELDKIAAEREALAKRERELEKEYDSLKGSVSETLEQIKAIFELANMTFGV